MVRTYTAAMAGFERATGIHHARWRVLDALARLGELPQRELTGQTLTDPAAISRILADFADAGYITRRMDPEDQRQLLVALTPAGQAQKKQVAAVRERFIAAAQANIPPDDLARLEATLEALCANLERMREDKA